MEIFIIKKFPGVWWRVCQNRATSAGGATGKKYYGAVTIISCASVRKSKENDVLCVISVISINSLISLY